MIETNKENITLEIKQMAGSMLDLADQYFEQNYKKLYRCCGDMAAASPRHNQLNWNFNQDATPRVSRTQT